MDRTMDTLRRYASMEINDNTKYRIWKFCSLIVLFVEFLLLIYCVMTLIASLRNHENYDIPIVALSACSVALLVLIGGLTSPWFPNFFLLLHLFFYQMLWGLINLSVLIVIVIGLIFFHKNFIEAIERAMKERKMTESVAEFLWATVGVLVVWLFYRFSACVVLFRFWRVRKHRQNREGSSYEPVDMDTSVY